VFHVGYLNWDADQTAVTDCVLAREKLSKKARGRQFGELPVLADKNTGAWR
jgi:hypothetical protein